MASAFAGESPGAIGVFTGQMWALRGRVQPGDVIVLPLKTSKKIAIGLCITGYAYDAAEADETRRHFISVDWRRDDVARAAIKDDLLNTLNGAMTIFEAKKNNAEGRLLKIMESGVDSGQGAGPPPGPMPTLPLPGPDSSDPVDPTPAPTLEVLRDRVRTHLVENFGQHKLTHLVAEILRAEGYVCDVSPEGPDFGVDIIAGRGPLGLDSPTLIVEVKSETGQIGVQVVNGLQGAIKMHRADQGLLVAWGGLGKPAVQALRTERLSVRVWDAEDVVDRLFKVYDLLPEDVRARIPLKRAWVLVEEIG